jgi:hypothetical protein
MILVFAFSFLLPPKKKQKTHHEGQINSCVAPGYAMPPKKLQFALTTRRDGRQPHYGVLSLSKYCQRMQWLK